jgi:hypothetical protein
MHGDPRPGLRAQPGGQPVMVRMHVRDELAMPYPGRADFRDLWVHTRLVYAAAVRGQLSPVDGAVELIAMSIDLHGPEHGTEDDGHDEDEARRLIGTGQGSARVAIGRPRGRQRQRSRSMDLHDHQVPRWSEQRSRLS